MTDAYANLPYATEKKDQPVKIRMGEGMAAEEPVTIMQRFDEVVAKFGDKPALHQKVIAAVSLFCCLWLCLCLV